MKKYNLQYNKMQTNLLRCSDLNIERKKNCNTTCITYHSFLDTLKTHFEI